MSSRKTFILLFFALVLTGVLETLVGPLIPVLSLEFSVNLTLMGLILSIHSIGILIASALSGYLIVHFSYKNIFIYSIIFSLVSSILLYFSNNYLIFSIFYFFLGVGNASIINSVSSYVCDIYKKNKSSRLLLINTGWLLGIFIAPLILSYFAWKAYQFKLIFLIIPLFQLIILFVILIRFKNPKISNDKKYTFKKVSKTLFSDKHFIISCLITFFYASTTSTFSNWLTTYFKDIGIELKYSTLFLSIYSASTIIGMFLKNYLLKYFPEKKILLSSSVLSFIFLLLASLINVISIKILFIVLFGINIIGVISLVISFESYQNNLLSGPINGLIRSFDAIGAMLSHYFVGYIVGNFKKINILNIVLIFLLVLLILLLLYYFYNPYSKKKAIM